MAKCQGRRLTHTRAGKLIPRKCGQRAVTCRRDFRFGDTGKGEPPVVDVRTPLCRSCAAAHDERAAEAAAEAAAS